MSAALSLFGGSSLTGNCNPLLAFCRTPTTSSPEHYAEQHAPYNEHDATDDNDRHIEDDEAEIEQVKTTDAQTATTKSIANSDRIARAIRPPDNGGNGTGADAGAIA